MSRRACRPKRLLTHVPWGEHLAVLVRRAEPPPQIPIAPHTRRASPSPAARTLPPYRKPFHKPRRVAAFTPHQTCLNLRTRSRRGVPRLRAGRPLPNHAGTSVSGPIAITEEDESGSGRHRIGFAIARALVVH